MKTPLKVLGLFPSFHEGIHGGVQTSARQAWASIVGEFGAEATKAICYESGTSRREAIWTALTERRAPDVTLVWHLHLLKLLPLLNCAHSNVLLFLHGIEAWRGQDVITRVLRTRVSGVLSNSRFTWDQFVSANPGWRDVPQRVVPLGLGADTPGPRICPAGHAPRAIMIGRLSAFEDYKGHRQVIEAWPAVQSCHPDAELLIVGDGDLRQTLERRVEELGLRSHVSFLGAVSDTAKQALLEQAGCLLLPSKGEGFGLVYLEAMRAGRPCLVSTVDAGREVVRPPEAGLAVDPDDRLAIAAAVCRLMAVGSPEWQRWSSQARVRYETHFTGERFGRRLIAALTARQLAPHGCTVPAGGA